MEFSSFQSNENGCSLSHFYFCNSSVLSFLLDPSWFFPSHIHKLTQRMPAFVFRPPVSYMCWTRHCSRQVSTFGVFTVKICKICQLACLCNNSKTLIQMFMKFYTGEFYWNLSLYSSIVKNRSTITNISPEVHLRCDSLNNYWSEKCFSSVQFNSVEFKQTL
jgi:hypothetical protein